MFKMYSIIILHENAIVKRTVFPKIVKQNDISHYFWKKLSKLDISQNTREKMRHLNKSRQDTTFLFSILMRYDQIV